MSAYLRLCRPREKSLDAYAYSITRPPQQTTATANPKMHRPIQKLLFSTSKTHFDVLATTAAQRSLTDVRLRLGSRWHDMTPSQAHGYIRARARRAVYRQAGLLAAEHGYRDQQSINAIDTRALEQTVQLIVQELLATHRTPLRTAG